MPPARVLTFDGPPAYLRGLTAAGLRVDRLVEPDPDPLIAWQAARALDDTVRDVRADHARRGIQRGAYDALLCHAPADLDGISAGDTATILVLHERRELLDLFGDGPDAWRAGIHDALTRTAIVFSAADVKASWGLDAPVIVPAVRPAEWPTSAGERREAVTVAPFAAERAILDTPYLLSVVTADPGLTVLGRNPGLGVEADTAALPERRRAFARARVYVSLSNPRFEPAAPVPMLEAMAASLPIVTLAHEHSPIVHGENGLVAYSAEELAGHTRTLLDDEEMARRLGRAARATIEARYSQSAFTTAWQELLARTASIPSAKTA